MVLFDMEGYSPQPKRVKLAKIESMFEQPETDHVHNNYEPKSEATETPHKEESYSGSCGTELISVYHNAFTSEAVYSPDAAVETVDVVSTVDTNHTIVGPSGPGLVEAVEKRVEDRSSGAPGMIGERIESMPFKCHICGGHFHKKSNLQRHWRIYHEISDFEVESITRVLLQSDKTDFTQMAGLSFKITCRFCPQVFHAETSPEAEQLREKHEVQFHSAQLYAPKASHKYQCPICGSDFLARGVYESHIKANHHLYSGTILRGEKSQASGITTDGRRLKCKYCPRLFTDVASRKKHEERIHMPVINAETRKSLDYPCQFCKKSFATEGAAKSHEAIDHHEEISRKLLDRIRKQETYDCDLCKGIYKTPTEQNLRRHYRIVHRLEHEEIDEKMKTARKMCQPEVPESTVRERVWCHTDKPSIHEIAKSVDLSAEVTPFLCSLCRRAFRTQHGYNMHRYKEHGIKNVKEEVRVKVRCFECDFCDDEFPTDAAKWLHHAEVHEAHKNKAYDCGMCESVYASGVELRKHWKIVHRLKDDLIAKIDLLDHEVRGRAKMEKARRTIRKLSQVRETKFREFD